MRLPLPFLQCVHSDASLLAADVDTEVVGGSDSLGGSAVETALCVCRSACGMLCVCCGAVTGWRGHRCWSSAATCSCPRRHSTVPPPGSRRWVVARDSTGTAVRRAAGSSVCPARRSTAFRNPSPNQTHTRAHPFNGHFPGPPRWAGEHER